MWRVKRPLAAISIWRRLSVKTQFGWSAIFDLICPGQARLECATEEKDLGVTIDVTLKPSKHCSIIARSANFAMGQILKSFHYQKKANLIPLFNMFVRPRLEFASSAWNPWLEGNIRCLERIQEKFLRQVLNVRGNTYEERLKDAGMVSLRERRERGDVIDALKTLNGFNNVNKAQWFNIADDNARSTRSTSTVSEQGEEERKTNVLHIEGARLDVRKYLYTV